VSFSYYEQKFTIPPYVSARMEKALFQTLHAEYFPIGGRRLGRQPPMDLWGTVRAFKVLLKTSLGRGGGVAFGDQL